MLDKIHTRYALRLEAFLKDKRMGAAKNYAHNRVNFSAIAYSFLCRKAWGNTESVYFKLSNKVFILREIEYKRQILKFLTQ